MTKILKITNSIPPYIIGDIHGESKTLLALLDRLNPQRPIYQTGDLIDRGPNPVDVIDICRKRKIKSVMGNHEHMFLCALGEIDGHAYGSRIGSLEVFLSNGGQETLDDISNTKDPDMYVKFIKKLPYAIILENFNVIISHAGFDPSVKMIDEVKKVISGCRGIDRTFLWRRPFSDYFGPYNDYIQVVGHTPLEKPFIGEGVVNVDTGCGKGGFLTAYDVERKEFIIQHSIV